MVAWRVCSEARPTADRRVSSLACILTRWRREQPCKLVIDKVLIEYSCPHTQLTSRFPAGPKNLFLCPDGRVATSDLISEGEQSLNSIC